jgi:hypothetical protein
VRINRLAGLAALAAVTLGTGACTNAEAGTTPAAPPTPAEVLLGSVPGATEPAYAFATKGDCRVALTGVHDAPNRAAKTSIVQKIPQAGTLTVSLLIFGENKPYARFALDPSSLQARLGLPKGWIALDPAKVTNLEADDMNFDKHPIDPLGMSNLIRAASGVAQEGSTYTGTVDLTKIDKKSLPVATKMLTKLGDKAKAVPFTAEVDEATGHLSTFKINTPAGKACTLTYSGYGKTGALSQPNAKKATNQVYALLNS